MLFGSALGLLTPFPYEYWSEHPVIQAVGIHDTRHPVFPHHHKSPIILSFYIIYSEFLTASSHKKQTNKQHQYLQQVQTHKCSYIGLPVRTIFESLVPKNFPHVSQRTANGVRLHHPPLHFRTLHQLRCRYYQQQEIKSPLKKKKRASNAMPFIPSLLGMENLCASNSWPVWNSDSEGKGAERLKDGRWSQMVGFLERSSVSKGIKSNSPWYSTLGVKPVTFSINISNSHGTSFGN